MQAPLNPVKSSARTLDILTVLAEYPDGLSLTDIGERLGIPLSSLHGLIGTLSQRGFLIQGGDSHNYLLGPRLLQLASTYRSRVDLITLADPIMDRIRREVGETLSLSVLLADTIVFVHKRAAEGVVQVVNPVGTRIAAHATGSGKVILAFLEKDEIDRIYPDEELPGLTPNTITSKSRLTSALEEIRGNNFAFDDEESNIGVWAVASSVRNEEGFPVAALSIVAPKSRLSTKDYSEWHLVVRNAAETTSAMLGFDPAFSRVKS